MCSLFYQDEKSSRFSPNITKKSKKLQKPSSTFDYRLTSANCYEEVQIHHPTQKADRPFIVISPKPEYAEKIRDGLLDKYPEKFVTPVLCRMILINIRLCKTFKHCMISKTS